MSHNFANTTIWTHAKANDRTLHETGTVVCTALVDMSTAEYAEIVLSIGTATAGSITYLEAIAGTSATDTTGGTSSLGTLAITSGTTGMFNYCVKADQMPTGGTMFLGARAFIATGGTVAFSMHIIRHRLRNMPPTNGFAGSALDVT